MKKKQIILAAILSIVFAFNFYQIVRVIKEQGWTTYNILIVFITVSLQLLLVLSLVFRKKLYFKSWILSKMNFLLGKEVRVDQSDISPDLLFDKILEVIEESDFELADTDRKSFQLLATTFPNFLTWGENMYVEIKEIENNQSEIKFISATIFGYSWNKNKKNTDKFFQLFEESLTI